MNNFSLIIPTHNRHSYLKRSIEYFKNLDAKVIYCDSSENIYTNCGFTKNIKYVHLPNTSFHEKILYVISNYKTTYYALCADDDFILFNSLLKGFEILKHKPNYKTLLGKTIFFQKEFNGKFYRTKQKLNKNLNYSDKENINIFFSNYHQVLWGIYHREILEKAFYVVKKSKLNNDNYIELILGSIACCQGGIKFINDIWGVRELTTSEHWGKRHSPIHNIFRDIKIMKDYINVKKNLDCVTFKGCTNLVLNKYLKKSLIMIFINGFFQIVKSLVKKLITINIQGNIKSQTTVRELNLSSFTEIEFKIQQKSEIKRINHLIIKYQA